jgi:MinD-like ATPase involved in chromosome partitioning or flagellar assembly
LKAETIGIISIKGGVGKTTTAVNLATVMAKNYNKKILLVDSNISSPNLGLHLGLSEAETGLHDVLENRILTREAIYKHEYGFDVIPSSIKGTTANPHKLKEKLKGVSKNYDLIILDTSPTINNELLAAMHAANKLFVVSTPDRVTLDMTVRATKVAKEKGTPILGIIVNRARNKKYEVPKERIEKKAKTPVIATIRENNKIHQSLHKTTPVVITNPHSKIAREFNKLAAVILEEKWKEPSLLKKMKNYLTEDYESFKHHNFKKKLTYYK